MAVPFISRLRLNPLKPKEVGKYYPAAAYVAEINVNQLADEISESTTLTPTDVLGVINSLLRIIPKYMLLGYKVRLDTFGIFKLSLKNKCKGYDTPKEVSANDIEGIKILFTPDLMMKAKMQRPQYTKLDARFLVDDEESESQGEQQTVPQGD